MFPSVPALVDALRRYRLLDAAQLGEVGRELTPRFALPLDLARELLRREWLTAYQVNQLMQGRGHELLRGSYILLERLGEGGMGTVFKAKHSELGPVVPLYLILKERRGHTEAGGRFPRSDRAPAQLHQRQVDRPQ